MDVQEFDRRRREFNRDSFRLREYEELYCQNCRGTGCENIEHLMYPLDKELVGILSVLHKKGYQTISCCAGHADRRGMKYATYIRFTKIYRFPKPEEPLRLNSQKDGQMRFASRVEVIRPKNWTKEHPDVEASKEFIKDNISKLTEWAEYLPLA